MTSPNLSDVLAAGGLHVSGLAEDSAVVEIRLDRPDTRNSQTPATWRALAAVGQALPSATRVVVLRSEGPVFSSGIDLRAFTPEGVDGDHLLTDIAAATDEGASDIISGLQSGFTWLHDRDDILTVAVVQGAAVGAGFQLALACDFRICAQAARFAMRETSLGLVPDLTGTHPLVRAVGYSRALELCVTGRWVGADEAATLGLATVVVDAEELDATVGDFLAAITAAPVTSVRATKSVLRAALENDAVAQRRFERETQIGLLRAMLAAMPPASQTTP